MERPPPWLCQESIFDKQKAESPNLEHAMITDGQSAYPFLKKSNMLFLLNMVQMMKAVGGLVETNHLEPIRTYGITEFSIGTLQSHLCS